MSCAVQEFPVGRGVKRIAVEVDEPANALAGKRARGGALVWAPEAAKGARTSFSREESEFMDRTTQLFEELKAEAYARVEEWKKAEAANREESRRIAEKYPIVFPDDAVTPQIQPQEAGAMPGSVPPASPSEEDSGASEKAGAEPRAMSARETPAMGPAKHTSPNIDSSAFSRSLSFKPEPLTELKLASKGKEVVVLPDLSLTPAAVSESK
jgi:hypothetical protein